VLIYCNKEEVKKKLWSFVFCMPIYMGFVRCFEI